MKLGTKDGAEALKVDPPVFGGGGSTAKTHHLRVYLQKPQYQQHHHAPPRNRDLLQTSLNQMVETKKYTSKLLMEA